jgi:putative heme-binding domain-containing protein
MSRLFPFAIFFASLLLCVPVIAQNGLKDLPDPSVEAQMAAFTLPKGAVLNLYAGEPATPNPVHMNWDTQGRLWVVNSPLYPHIQPGQEESDTLVVLVDNDNDGVAETSHIFADDLHIPTGVLPGDGGVYVANSTEILFLRDTDGDMKADERRVVLSGFGTEDTHHLVHTLRWGPEGEMWFNQSIYIHTHLETPYGVRRLLGGGMWHFRTETQQAEVFMKGLVNPWGHTFDQWGQSFMTDGAGGEGINFVYPRAVFKTSPGASRTLSGLNPGQPKHCSLEILDGDHLPENFQGLLAAPDFRGNRINLFRLTDKGSAYLSTQVEDLISSTHRAFRPIDIKMGPDGAIYIVDWYNPIIQHGEVDFRDPRRDHQHGRIWRMTFPDQPLAVKADLSKADNAALVAALHAPAALTRNLAMVEMRQRDSGEMRAALESVTKPEAMDPDLFALRSIWANQALNSFTPEGSIKLFDSQNPKIRAGALRSIYYQAAKHPEEALALATRAVADPNAQVRLWGVSVLAQLPSSNTVALALNAREGIEVDDFLDFAIWSICREHASRWKEQAKSSNPFASLAQLLYAVRALDQAVAVPQILAGLDGGELSGDKTVSEVTTWIAKVGTADDLAVMLRRALAESTAPSQQITILAALSDAARLRKVVPSGELDQLARFLESKDSALFSQAATLAGLWKLESARPTLVSAFEAVAKDAARAEAALAGLVTLGGSPTADLFDKLAKDSATPFQLRSLAVVGRTRMNLAAGAPLAVSVLRDSPDGTDPYGIFNAFLSNKQGPDALVTALTDQQLPQAIALVGVQKAGSAASKPENLIAALQKAGNLTPMKLALIPSEMEELMQKVATRGNPHQGESIYRRAALQCAVCHAIGGSGGIIGPDLVSIGASAPVDYLVESLLEPSKKIKEGYHTTFVTLKNGNSFAGAIAREDANELVIRDAVGAEQRLPKADIASNQISPVSLMPPGLTAALREDEFIDLVSFLSHLGKDGDFKTPSQRFIRHWQALQPHETTRDAHGHHGNKIFIDNVPGYQWTPLYATVSGAIPVVETPDVRGRNGRNAVTRSFLEVPSANSIKVKISGKLKDLNLLWNTEEIDLPDEGDSIALTLPVTTPGRQKITLVGLAGFGLDRITVELLDDGQVVTPLSLPEF